MGIEKTTEYNPILEAFENYKQSETYRLRRIHIKELEYQRYMLFKNDYIKEDTAISGKPVKEVFCLPMPSSNEILRNRQIDLRTYGSIMLESNWGGNYKNKNNKFIYKEKLDSRLKEIAQEIGISESKLKKDIIKLRKCNVDGDIKLIELTKDNKDNPVYILNYGVKCDVTEVLKQYVTISNVALKILKKSNNDNIIRIYLILLYKLRNGDTCLTQEEICDNMGFSYKSRKVISDCLNSLEKLGFIDIRQDYKEIVATRKDGLNYAQMIPKFYYKLSDRYLESTKKIVT